MIWLVHKHEIKISILNIIKKKVICIIPQQKTINTIDSEVYKKKIFKW